MRAFIGRIGWPSAALILASLAAAAGIAYAAIPDGGGVYTACKLNATGTIRLIDPSLWTSSLLGHCTSLEMQITWNERGQQGAQGLPGANGADGVSPTVAQVQPSDPNCAAGGAAMTDAAGHTAYVCNGADGAKGADGQPFSGTFTSPNGLYSITVGDTGVTVSGPSSSRITLAGGNLTVRSQTFDLRSDTSLSLRAGSSAQLEASSPLTLRGSTVDINDGGSCSHAVRTTDAVIATDPQSGFSAVAALAPGSSTVCIG